MLEGFALLLVYQLAGELITRLTGIPVPGPVLGMTLLLITLVYLNKVPQGLRSAAEGLLRYLPLLFVPAGVGLINHGLLLKQDIWLISITLAVSTLITLVVTVLALTWFKKLWKVDDV